MSEPTAEDLLRFMKETEPKDWPSPRGYGYGNEQGQRMKKWHLWVFRDLLAKLQARKKGVDHE